MPPFVRCLITLLIAQPGRLACLVGLTFSLFLALDIIYGIRWLTFDRPMLLPASLGAAVIGFGMVMFAAVLKRRPDESLTARQTAALAALSMLTEALTELSVLLLIGASLCFFTGHRTAALHLGLSLLVAVFAHWGAHRLEKRLEQDRDPEETEPPKDG